MQWIIFLRWIIYPVPSKKVSMAFSGVKTMVELITIHDSMEFFVEYALLTGKW